MLKVIALFLVLLAATSSVNATLPNTITGWWHNDNEERFAEMQLHSDGSFASLNRNNAILAVIPLQQRSGTWRLQGSRLTIDAADPHTHERTRTLLNIVQVTDRALRVRTTDGHTNTYRRLSYRTCVDTEVRRSRGVSVNAVVGRWRGHYRTHELELSLEDRGLGTLSISDPGHPSHAKGACTWQLAHNILSLLPVKEEDREGTIRWTLTAVSRDCISFIHSGMVYSLQRVRRPALPPRAESLKCPPCSPPSLPIAVAHLVLVR